MASFGVDSQGAREVGILFEAEVGAVHREAEGLVMGGVEGCGGGHTFLPHHVEDATAADAETGDSALWPRVGQRWEEFEVDVAVWLVIRLGEGFEHAIGGTEIAVYLEAGCGMGVHEVEEGGLAKEDLKGVVSLVAVVQVVPVVDDPCARPAGLATAVV